MTELPLRYLLVGPAKSGKTTQMTTMPAPRLMIDLEQRARFTPAGADAVFWNGEDDPNDLPKSPSHTYILETNQMHILDTARSWLHTCKHPFKSVGLDSVMELKYQVEKFTFPGKMDLDPKEKGKVNKIFEDVVRDIRDLTTLPGSPVKCVMFISGASVDPFSGHVKPIIQGRIGDLMPYWMELVGYMEVNKNQKRELFLAQRPAGDLEVGDSTNRIVTKLGSKLTEDVTVEALFNALQEAS